jgi:hypothetical protein
MSLLDIQQHERDAQAQRNELKMAPKSLLEIQEQERKDEQAKVAELEFQRWWAAEEARVAAEAAKTNSKQGKRKPSAPGPAAGDRPGPGAGQGAGRPKNKKKGNASSQADAAPAEKKAQLGENAHPRPPKAPKPQKPQQPTIPKKSAPTGPARSTPTTAPTPTPTPPAQTSSPMPASLNPFAKPFGFVPGPPAGPLADRRA